MALSILPYSRCLPFDAQVAAQFNLNVKVCAGGPVSGGPRSSCGGDSGGPLFVERYGVWVQIGIACYGLGGGCTHIPTVLVKVLSFTDWVAGFVPDLQISNAGAGMVDGPSMLDESSVEVLSADMPNIIASLSQGKLVYDEVTGARRVGVRSLSGDADVLIFTGTTLEASAIVCYSYNASSILGSKHLACLQRGCYDPSRPLKGTGRKSCLHH